MKRLLTIALAATALTACDLGGTTHITTAPTMPLIQVSATGEVSMAPDMVTVTAGVVSEGKTAREASMSNATHMTSVFEELEAAGIPRKNITTSQLTLQPRYDYSDRKAPRITGYEMRNTVMAKSYDLEQIGPMLDALVDAGVNNINGINFSIKDASAAKAEARDKAIKEARAQAEAMAKAAGVSLGALQSLSESQSGGIVPRPYATMEMSRAATPVSAGEQQLTVTVNLSYAINE